METSELRNITEQRPLLFPYLRLLLLRCGTRKLRLLDKVHQVVGLDSCLVGSLYERYETGLSDEFLDGELVDGHVEVMAMLRLGQLDVGVGCDAGFTLRPGVLRYR